MIASRGLRRTPLLRGLIETLSAEANDTPSGIETTFKRSQVARFQEIEAEAADGGRRRGSVNAFDLFKISPDQLPKSEWLVEGLIHERGLWVTVGLPKRGKSLLRRLVTVSVALGLPLFGQRTKEGKVLMLIDEDELGDEWEAMATMAEALGGSARRLRGRVFVVPPQGVQVDEPLDVAAVRKLMNEIDPSLVLIDPLVRYHRQDENQAEAMQAVLRPLASLGRDRCIGVIHHTDKSGRGPRGTGDILASYKTLWRIDADEGDVADIRLEITLKAGRSPDPIGVGFQRGEGNWTITWSTKESNESVKGDVLKKAILAAAQRTPFPSKTALANAVQGQKQRKLAVIRSLLKAGQLADVDGSLTVPVSAPKESGTPGTKAADRGRVVEPVGTTGTSSGKVGRPTLRAVVGQAKRSPIKTIPASAVKTLRPSTGSHSG